MLEVRPLEKQNVIMQNESTVEEVAGKLYSRYCAAVGGKAFNGDPLPDWDTFRHDMNKAKQVDAWREVAREAQSIQQ